MKPWIRILVPILTALALTACTAGPDAPARTAAGGMTVQSPPAATMVPGTPEVGETLFVQFRFTDLAGVYAAHGLPAPQMEKGKRQTVLAGHTDWSDPDKCVVTLWNRMFKTSLLPHEIWHCARGAYHPPHVVTMTIKNSNR